MRILIIEDEIPTQRLLAGTLNQLRPTWEIVDCIGTVEESVDWLQQHPHPDLIFSDIQLSDGTCFEIYEQIVPQSFVIFTTAYDEYAIQAFKVNSIDYLLKPVSPDMLEQAIHKFESLPTQQASHPLNLEQLADSLMSGQKKYRSRIIVNTADGFYKMDVDQITFFYSSHKVVTAITRQNESHVIDFTLDKLEKQLDPSLFFRANRQFILHIDAISKVENWFNGKLVVKTRPEAEEKIVVSRERARLFKEWINQ